MCGIFGVVYSDATTLPPEDRLRASVRILAHRGPDASGVHSEPGVGLAHTRLSLLDPQERSDQPFWSPDGRYCLVYNGEIYNFRALRRELEQRGVSFRTSGDTEVLLMSLVHDGLRATLAKLSGMFAFAFYDERERNLVLARDRFGIKPLFTHTSSGMFLFSSEVKAFREWVKLEPDPFGVSSFLIGPDQATRNRCMFADTEILPPGTALRLEVGGTPRVESFADMSGFFDKEQGERLALSSADACVDALDERLGEAVKTMLLADVAVGALCSGGVDSSLLLAMAARSQANLAIYHADVCGPLSEYDAAAALARHLGLELRKVEVHDRDFVERTADAIYHYDYPFARFHSSVPLMLVSELVRQTGVKAVLTGEGADECFLGYPWIGANRTLAFLERQKERSQRLLARAPWLRGLSTQGHRADRLALLRDMLNQFEHRQQRDDLEQAFGRAFGRGRGHDAETAELLALHLPTLLHRNDTMAMAASVEARFPFLDERLVGFAVNLPRKYKLRLSPGVWQRDHPFVRDKWLLRRVADRYLPKSLSQRRKFGFQVSTLRRMRVAREYFEGSFVRDYLKLGERQFDYFYDSAGQSTRIKLMMLEVWGQIFMNALSRGAARDKLGRHATFVAPADWRHGQG